MSILDASTVLRGHEPPRRAFVTVDEIDPRNAGQSDDWLIRFDGVDGDSFDRLDHHAPLEIKREKISTYIIEASNAYSKGKFYEFFDAYCKGGEERRWWSVEFTPQDAYPQVQVFPNLFDDPFRMHVRNIAPAGAVENDRLNALCALPPSRPELAKRIQDVIDYLALRVAGVGVLDVGQGSASALLDFNGAPIAYFDLGGGVTTNRRTWPRAFSGYCTAEHPVFVLSHWDLDHWAAHRNCSPFKEGPSKYSGSTWIVPSNPPGDEPSVSHGKFFDHLVKSGAEVLQWPDGVRELGTGRLRIRKCGGSTRNDAGLALIVEAAEGLGDVLLPGDASLNWAGYKNDDELGLVVSPHHGAYESNLGLESDGPAIVVSFGRRNTFGHPDFRTLRRWASDDWVATADRQDQDDWTKLGGVLIDLGVVAGFRVHPGCPLPFAAPTIHPRPPRRVR